MSNFLAIATVTATLQRRLQQALDDAATASPTAVQNAFVFVDRPDTDHAGAGMHLYLMGTSRNASWASRDLPTYNGSGDPVDVPTEALDLHYLMTFFGDDDTLEAQRVMGVVAAYLTAQPALTPAMIQATAADPVYAHIAGTDLDGQPEKVRLTLASVDLEDMGRIWSSLPQEAFSPALACAASLVLVQPDGTATGPALPVTEPTVTAIPAGRPHITAVASASGPGAPIGAGDAVVGRGSGLAAANVRVEIDGTAVAAASIATVSATTIDLTLPTGLEAGVRVLQVIHVLGASPVGTEFTTASNPAPFALRPRVSNPAVVASGAVRLTVDPAVGASQEAEIILTPSVGGPSHARPAAVVNAAGTQLEASGADLAAGSYIVRARVDDIESIPDYDNIGAETVALP